MGEEAGSLTCAHALPFLCAIFSNVIRRRACVFALAAPAPAAQGSRHLHPAHDLLPYLLFILPGSCAHRVFLCPLLPLQAARREVEDKKKYEGASGG